MEKDRTCKVDTQIERWNLDETVGFKTASIALTRKWTGEGVSDCTTRELASWFNQRILERVYAEAGLKILDSRLRADYEVLQDGDEIERESVKTDLEQNGVPVDKVLQSFVSQATIYRHLTKCLDVSKSRNENSGWERDKIRIRREELHTGVRDALRTLAKKDELADDPAFVTDEDALDIATAVYLEFDDESIRLNRILRRGYIRDDGTE